MEAPQIFYGIPDSLVNPKSFGFKLSETKETDMGPNYASIMS
jgi:hypothetical protein